MENEGYVENEDDIVEVAIGLKETEVKAKRKIFIFLVFLNISCRYYDVCELLVLIAKIPYHYIYSALAVKLYI